MSKRRSAFEPKWIGLLACGLVVIFASQATADYAAAVLADNPLGYWRFNDAADSGTAVNSGTAGDELDGEYIDVERVPGPQEVDGRKTTGFEADNMAIRMEDFDTYVAVDASPMNDVESDPGFTFEGWVSADPREGNRVGLWGQNDVPEFGFIQPFRIQLWTPGGGNVNWDFTEDDIEDESWFHIAATSSFEETLLYINGEFVQAGPGQPNETFGFSDFTFNIGGGGVYDPTGNQFFGNIDEVAIWTERVLTEEEIQAHFEAAFGDADPCAPLNDGSLTDPTARAAYVHDVLGTWMGDSNKDGEFNSGDLVAVFTAGEYEDGVPENSSWATGDWNGDKDFDSSDLVVAFSDGGFEMGPRPEGQAVPEPTSLAMFLSAMLIGLLSVSRRQRK